MSDVKTPQNQPRNHDDWTRRDEENRRYRKELANLPDKQRQAYDYAYTTKLLNIDGSQAAQDRRKTEYLDWQKKQDELRKNPGHQNSISLEEERRRMEASQNARRVEILKSIEFYQTNTSVSEEFKQKTIEELKKQLK
jgi:hypothetical protein